MSEYFSTKIEENKFEPKKLWQSLKYLCYNNTKIDSQNIVLSVDNEICHDIVKVCIYVN